jgi:hypothetical protein
VWAFRPRSLRALVEASRFAAIATVTGVEAGPPLPQGDPNEPDTPTQRVAFEVTRRVLGRAPSRFTLFKTGSEEVWGEGDPPYVVGERYLLFVRKRRDDAGMYLPVAPDGRLRIVQGGLVESLIHGRIARLLAGLTMREAAPAILRARSN